MNKYFLVSGLLLINLLAGSTQAQTIFSYGKTPVAQDEFLRMYNKNIMNQKPDMSEKGLNDYIQLYYRFKIKVAEAEAQKIDTIGSLSAEINSYKKQLAKSYLTDQEEKSNLVKEAYDRSKKDVHVAHIVAMLPRNVQDTMGARRKIDSVYKLIQSGKYSFDDAAKEFSDSKKEIDLGFFNILQAPYAMESAAYQIKVGEVSKPFKTSMGYHIIKKIEERPAKGEVQVAQILFSTPKYKGEEGKSAAKAKADSVLKELRRGANFEAMVKAVSEDRFTVNSEGVLPPFGIAYYPKAYEDAAFALKNPGDLSEPVLTDYGYHILKLIKKMPIKTFEEAKNELTKKVEKNERMEIAREIFSQKLKTKNKYKEYPEQLTALIKSIPDTAYKNNILNFDLIPKTDKPVLEVGANKYTVADFIGFVQTQTKGRLYGGVEGGLTSMYKTFAEKVLSDTEEKNLEKENKEYAQLVKEYRDGTILYELISREVWNKASNDTVGLKQFYQENKNKYQWGPSFDGKQFKAANIEDLRAFADASKRMNIADALVQVNGKDGGVVKVAEESGRYEFEKVESAVKTQEEGKLGEVLKDADGQYVIYLIDKRYNNPSPKTLDEARGYVIADFQDSLEKSWISSLEAKYPLKVNAPVVKALVKK